MQNITNTSESFHLPANVLPTNAPDGTIHNRIDLRILADTLIQISNEVADTDQATQAILHVVVQSTGAKYVAYHSCGAEPRLRQKTGLAVRADANFSDDEAVYQLALLAVEQQTLQSARLQHGDIAFAVPVKSSPAEVLTVVSSIQEDQLNLLIPVVQLFAAYLGQLRSVEKNAQIASELANATEFNEAWNTVLSLPEDTNLAGVGSRIVRFFQKKLDADFVSLVLHSKRRGKVIALAPSQAFDPKSELVQAFEAASDEAAILAKDPSQVLLSLNRGQTEATQNLLKIAVCETASAIFLRNATGELVGIVIALGASAQPSLDSIAGFSRVFGQQLTLRQRSVGSIIDYGIPRLHSVLRDRKLKAIAVCGAVLIGILLMPLSLKIKSNCVAEPLKKRFIAAPFDGMLKEVLCDPGDLVHENEVIARMDPRDIQDELDSIEADYNKVKKECDRAIVDGETANAQLARLEMERLQLSRDMLTRRMKNLEVKSPTSGIVISGDLKKLEGARLQTGQTLVEIGPLDDMIFEVAVADEDVSHVHIGQTARVRLDALPGTVFHGLVERIRPRSEQRDRHNVFIAEVIVNDDQTSQLRPGMSGRAKIIADSHPLVWNLFHKAWERMVYRFGW